jgi:hypothetical protein
LEEEGEQRNPQPGDNFMKLFFLLFITDEEANLTNVLDPGKPFLPGLLFPLKDWGLCHKYFFGCYKFRSVVSLCYRQAHFIGLYRHTSFLHYGLSYACKKFYDKAT